MSYPNVEGVYDEERGRIEFPVPFRRSRPGKGNQKYTGRVFVGTSGKPMILGIGKDWKRTSNSHLVLPDQDALRSLIAALIALDKHMDECGSETEEMRDE